MEVVEGAAVLEERTAVVEEGAAVLADFLHEGCSLSAT